MNDSAAKSTNAILFGAAIGLVVGMLVAPKSGRENRERIKHEYAKTKDQLQKGAHDIAGKAKNTANKMKQDSDAMLNDTGTNEMGPI